MLIALIAALLASVFHLAFSLVLPRGDAAQLIVIGLGLGYGLYLLGRSRERAGRVLLVFVWLAISLVVAALFAGVWPQILTQIGLVWLTRVVYHQPDPLAALLDLGLLLLGLATAVWTLERTGSLFLMVWTLFLIQALFTRIPSLIGSARGVPPRTDPFDTAERAAERALRRLASLD
ncbi:hypothetical protein CKO27_12825 [Thiocystis violacea]|nr:hypothetical protein [Thiocystis violacea]